MLLEIISLGSQIVGAVAAVATFLIALRALKSWRDELRAQRLSAFLDELLTATHEYGRKITRVIAIVRTIQIGFESHIPLGTEGTLIQGAIAFLSNGSWRSEIGIREALADIESDVHSLRSLLAKGDALGFEGYVSCINALRMLIFQFSRSSAISNLISTSSWNFENNEVLELVERIVAIEPNEMLAETDQALEDVHRFVKSGFEIIYR